MGVKLGHRRVSSRQVNDYFQWESSASIELTWAQILQREIARTGSVSVEQLSTPFISGHHDDYQGNGRDDSRPDGRGATGTGGKRKYRRHPKVSTFYLWFEMLHESSNFSVSG